jgi:hypothetical protein
MLSAEDDEGAQEEMVNELRRRFGVGDGSGDGSGGGDAGETTVSGLEATLKKNDAIVKAAKSKYVPRKRDVSRNLNIARNSRKRMLQDKALTNPTEFYKLRDAEFLEMEATVISTYESIFQKYIDKAYSEDDADDRAEKVAKSLMNVLTSIIEEDYGGTADKAAVSRKALQSAANTIGKGGMQL